MTKTSMIRARMEPTLKEDAEKVFKILGLSTTEALTLFYKQVSLNRKIPFEIKIPNHITEAAMKDAVNHTNLNQYNNLEELKNHYK